MKIDVTVRFSDMKKKKTIFNFRNESPSHVDSCDTAWLTTTKPSPRPPLTTNAVHNGFLA